MRARRFAVGVVTVLCVSLTMLVLGGAVALAAKEYVPGLFAGGEGSGDGQFVEPVGVAVNDSSDPTVGGDVYVVDKGNNRVERFSSTGTYLSQFNGSGLLPGEGKAAGSGAGEELTGQFSNRKWSLSITLVSRWSKTRLWAMFMLGTRLTMWSISSVPRGNTRAN